MLSCLDVDQSNNNMDIKIVEQEMNTSLGSLYVVDVDF